MSRFEWGLKAFEDVQGQLRIIRGCPLTQLDELWDCLNLLQDAIASSDPTLDFNSLYLDSGYIRQLVNHCLKLCGIQPDWCSLEMMVQLVHHTTDTEGNFTPGLLIQLNFPNRGKPKGDAVGFKEWVADNFALLVGLGLCKDLGEAIDLASKLPADQMEAIITARLYQLNPELKTKETLKSEAEKLTPEQIESLLDFSQFQWRDDIDLNNL